MVWVTTEGGDYDNTLLKPYEEALHKAKVTFSPVSVSMTCCAVLCCAVLCCAVLIRFVIMIVNALTLAVGSRNMFPVRNKGRRAHCRRHHCSSSQAGCGHLSHGHLRLWVSRLTPLAPDMCMLPSVVLALQFAALVHPELSMKCQSVLTVCSVAVYICPFSEACKL